VGFFETFQKEIISLGITLLTSLVFWLFRARPILRYGQAHDFTFVIRPPPPPQQQGGGTQQLQPQPFTAQTCSYLFANGGRVAATGVEITFNFEPNNYQVWPVRPYDIHRSPDDRFTLRFANLAPKEQFQIEVLSVQMPSVLNVRCAETVGRQTALRVVRRFPRWVDALFLLNMFLGFAAAIYIILRFGSYILSLAIPH
jgi:hypothetical protein